MSEHDQKDLCTEFDTDMSSYNKLDFMMLTRALKSSYVIGKAHVNGNGGKNPYMELRKSYSNYSCRVKSRIDEANNRRLITSKVVYVCFMAFSVWVMYLMGKQLKNAFTMKPVSITIVNALIVIILMNPIFSFVTVTIDIMNYSSSNMVPANNVTDIEKLEQLLRAAVDCEDNFEANISVFVKAFEESELFVTLDTQRMEKINQIQQFIVNHKNFLERSNNPNIGTKLKESIEDCFNFMFGTDPKMLNDMFDSELSSDDKSNNIGIYYKTSKQVRLKTPSILNYLDPMIDPADIESYAKYFLDDLNDNLIRLVGYVTQHSIHLQMGVICENPNVQTYTGANKESAILDAFTELSTRIRRLQMLNLPEYDYLMECLNPSKIEEWSRMLLEFDPTLNNKRDLYTVIEIFINNTTYFFTVSSQTDDACKVIERTVMKRIDGVDYTITVPALSCDLKPNFAGCATIHESMQSFDIREVYATYTPNYLNAESKIYRKTTNLIKSLKSAPLNQDFRKSQKMEVDIIMDVLSNKLESIEWTVDQIMQVIDERTRMIARGDTGIQDTFSENARVLFEELKITIEERKVTGELTHDKREAIQNPTNFVSFDQFNAKLSSMTSNEYMLLHKSIMESAKNVTFFHDRMDEINNSMERKIFMGGSYWNYIMIYYVVSFLLLSEYLWKYYTGETVDISLLSKLEVRRLNKK